jgi:hypothetical protein
MATANTGKSKKNTGDTATTVSQKSESPIIPKDIDPTQYVTVRNGFQGTLVYQSPRTGELFLWEGFGTEQEMELRELKNAKNASKKFFINNWFMFDEDWVIDYLGVRQFYQNALKIEDFDEIFKLSPAKLEKKIAVLSDGQKKSVIHRAVELIQAGEIDSRKVIETLENALGVELIER